MYTKKITVIFFSILVQLYAHEILKCQISWEGVRVMVFSATFINISVISWLPVLLMGETGENNQPATSH